MKMLLKCCHCEASALNRTVQGKGRGNPVNITNAIPVKEPVSEVVITLVIPAEAGIQCLETSNNTGFLPLHTRNGRCCRNDSTSETASFAGMTKAFILLISVLMAVLAASCKGGGKPAELTAINTATVVKGTIEKTVMFTGNIDARDAADVFPRGTGKVSKKLLKEGDAVKKGQAIMFVDRDEIGFKFKPMPVDSPIDGFVGNISVDVGSNIGPSNPVAKVVRPGNIRVKLDIPERYLEVILPGTDVTLTVDTLNGMTFKGKIVTSSPVVDEKTRTARVEVEVPNPENILRHGMFGRMNLVTEQKDNALTVPNETISWEGDKQFVYRVVTPEGSGTTGVSAKVERLQVKVGLRNETHVEVTEGITEGDVLASSNLIDLKDGEAVKIKN